MARIIICADCGGERRHYAKGLCPPCYQSRYRGRHREEKAIYNRRYREEHREDLQAYERQRYQNDATRAKANRRWALEHPEKMREYNCRYLQKNPKKGITDQARRKAQKRSLPDTLTTAQSDHLLTIGQSMYPGEELDLDHIVPLSKGGGTTLANMHAIPARLNESKADKLPEEVYKQEVLWPH